MWSTFQRLKRAMDIMLVLGLKETIDQLTMKKPVRWYGHVLWRVDGHFLRKALDFEIEYQRNKVWLKRT